jgi:AcrR family transcriptional regulator
MANDEVACAPAGLRERKKRRTAKVLRDTARDYFQRVPFDEAKLTDIADAAEVSAPTVYKYFPTKLELMYAVAREDNLEIVAKARKLHSRSWNDPVDALHALGKLLFRWFDSYDRSALQAIVAAAFQSRSKTHAEYEHLDDLNTGATIDLVRVLQQQRLIDEAVDPKFLGSLVFDLINAEFFALVGDGQRSVDAACASLRRRLQFIAPIWARLPHPAGKR